MNRTVVLVLATALMTLPGPVVAPAYGQWVTRDARWERRGGLMVNVRREFPRLYREFNGIDFGHAHLAETLLHTQDRTSIENARMQVLDFIFSSPSVPPDESTIFDGLSPRGTRVDHYRAMFDNRHRGFGNPSYERRLLAAKIPCLVIRGSHMSR